MSMMIIQVDENLKNAFAKCAKLHDRSTSSLIRELMRNFLEKNNAKIDEDGVFLSEEELKICEAAKKEIEAGEFVYFEDL